MNQSKRFKNSSSQSNIIYIKNIFISPFKHPKKEKINFPIIKGRLFFTNKIRINKIPLKERPNKSFDCKSAYFNEINQMKKELSHRLYDKFNNNNVNNLNVSLQGLKAVDYHAPLHRKNPKNCIMLRNQSFTKRLM